MKDKVAEAYFCQGDRGERRSGHFSFSADLESGVQLTFPELGKTNSLRIQEVYPGSVCAINVFLYSDNLNLFFKWQSYRGGGVRRGRRQTVRVSIICRWWWLRWRVWSGGLTGSFGRIRCFASVLRHPYKIERLLLKNDKSLVTSVYAIYDLMKDFLAGSFEKSDRSASSGNDGNSKWKPLPWRGVRGRVALWRLFDRLEPAAFYVWGPVTASFPHSYVCYDGVWNSFFTN